MKVYMPWKNLGCFGVIFGSVYMDIFVKPFFGFFVNNGRNKYRGRILNPFSWKEVE